MVLLKLAAISFPAKIGAVDCFNNYIVVVRRFVFMMHVSPPPVTMMMLAMHSSMDLQVGCVVGVESGVFL